MCRDDMPCEVKKSTMPGMVLLGGVEKKWKNSLRATSTGSASVRIKLVLVPGIDSNKINI